MLEKQFLFSVSTITGNVCFSLIEGWLTLYHLASIHSVNVVSFQTVVFPVRAHLFSDTNLIRNYKIVNREALKI